MFKKNNSSAVSIIFRDILFGALFVFLTMLFLVLPYINPKITQENVIDIRDKIVIVMTWDKNVDLDLVVQGPNLETVYFKHNTGEIFSLVRDDRGTLFDDTGINFEIVSGRILPDGIYRISGYVFSLSESDLPTNGKIEIYVNNAKIIEETFIASELEKEFPIVNFIIVNEKLGRQEYYHDSIMPKFIFVDEE